MRVIGTAGHVDHGKSTLVQALTGTHPDRLKEEREREMTIDLGFAFMQLPNGQEIGIVDVPGHRDFIENMLAGVGGIDAVIFVVAADEGVMPQTREHLAILDLLQVQGGVVALTKADLAPDSDWLGLVEDELRAVLNHTVLADAPIIRVSARTGAGIPALVNAVAQCLQDRPARLDLGRPRLPVDRVFSVAGFGTVVTGTLLDGKFSVGDEVEILPAGMRSRVRGLQAHNRKESVAFPGARTAVNLAGVDLESVRRGSWIAHPGKYPPTRRLDVRFKQLKDVSKPIRHNLEVKFFIGAAEVVARLRLLGSEALAPGEEGWLQLELREPVVAVRGDHFILRRPSPGETLGGGVVVDPHPKARHRRFDGQMLARLADLSKGKPEDILRQWLYTAGVAQVKDVMARAGLPTDVSSQALQALFQEGVLVILDSRYAAVVPEAWVCGLPYFQTIENQIQAELSAYHTRYPLRRGMAREELKSRLKLDARIFSLLLQRMLEQKMIHGDSLMVWQPGYEVRLTPAQENLVKLLDTKIQRSPYAPPSVKEMEEMLGSELYNALVSTGFLTQVSQDVAFKTADYRFLAEQVRGMIEKEGKITVADFRDRFNSSRRYALAFLEHLDAIGVTVRKDDVRYLR